MSSGTPSAANPPGTTESARKRSVSTMGINVTREMFDIGTPVLGSDIDDRANSRESSIMKYGSERDEGSTDLSTKGSHRTGRGRAVRGSEEDMAKKRNQSTPPLLAFFVIFRRIMVIFEGLHDFPPSRPYPKRKI